MGKMARKMAIGAGEGWKGGGKTLILERKRLFERQSDRKDTIYYLPDVGLYGGSLSATDRDYGR